ncbi:MAG: ester cyclase [Chloroflexi bacterium]|nr:ester cyclase [Chloroflexota bacterium]
MTALGLLIRRPTPSVPSASSLSEIQKEAPPMSAREDKAIVREFFAMLDQDYAVAFDLYAAPTLSAEMAGMPPMDRDGFRGLVAGFYAAMPDLVHDIEAMIAEDGTVATKLTIRGTHTGEMMGIPGSGASVAAAAMNIYRVEDGKLVSARIVADMMSLMTQIGAIPSPAAAGA